jgi:hypothetical protein
MKTNETIDEGRTVTCRLASTSRKRYADLARAAIEQGQAKALREYLAKGLDPQSELFLPYPHLGFCNLIDIAARHGQLECMKTLNDFGAKPTEKGMISLMKDVRNRHVIFLFLSMGHLGPAGLTASGALWSKRLKKRLSPQSFENYLQACSEWEREQLASESVATLTRRPHAL